MSINEGAQLLEHILRRLPPLTDATAAAASLAYLPIVRDLTSGMDRILSYERPDLQDKARRIVPLEALRARVAEEMAIAAELGLPSGDSTPEDALLRHLTLWFKTQFFRWVDTLPCARCGGQTRSGGMLQPSHEDMLYGAARVEAHMCLQCGHATRFPRYNDPGRLLDSRRGRCGEWANCFALCCRAAGFEVRWTRDWADHVWCEVYSTGRRRWVHVDPCEASIDAPLLYEKGWGKKVALVMAFHRLGARDVTPRYTASMKEAQRLRRAGGIPGPRQLDVLTEFSRRGPRGRLGAADSARWTEFDAVETAELIGGRKEAVVALPGRQTGSAAWREGRGEAGARGGTGAASGESALPSSLLKPGTSWARDTFASSAPLPSLPSSFPPLRRITGGYIRASGDNHASNEVTSNLLDGTTATKWLDFGGGGAAGNAWVQYALPRSAAPLTPSAYLLVAANDCPERDPSSWVLQGLPEGADPSDPGGYEDLDVREGEAFGGRYEARWFAVEKAKERGYRLFRLLIRRVRGPAAADSVQLARWEIFHEATTTPDTTQPAPPPAEPIPGIAAMSVGPGGPGSPAAPPGPPGPAGAGGSGATGAGGTEQAGSRP